MCEPREESEDFSDGDEKAVPRADANGWITVTCPWCVGLSRCGVCVEGGQVAR